MDPMQYFCIKGNNTLKRFEFESKINLLPSYTVYYHEADNINDAKIAVYLALKKEAERLDLTIHDFFQKLADTGIC